MLNRSAVFVRPKKPFCDWLRAVDYDDAPAVTLDQMGPTLYLVPDYEDPADAEKVLKKVYEEIFCRELGGLVHGRRRVAEGPKLQAVQAVVRCRAL